MTNFFELLFASALLILSLGLNKAGTWCLPTTFKASNEIHNSSGSEEESSGENEHNSYPRPNPSFRDVHNFIEPDSNVCNSNEDCSSNYCCTVGMMRYSIPTCLPMGQLGDSCIPTNSPRNFTLSYPNGEQLTAIDSFKLLCPCAWGYVCDEDSVSCVEKPRGNAPSVKTQSHENHPDPLHMKQSEPKPNPTSASEPESQTQAKDLVLKKH